MQYEFYDREHLSRKTSLEEGTTDVYRRQWGSSDPVVRSFDKQVTVVGSAVMDFGFAGILHEVRRRLALHCVLPL
jgi:hypothetical protein